MQPKKNYLDRLSLRWSVRRMQSRILKWPTPFPVSEQRKFGPLLSLPGVHSENRSGRYLLSMWSLHYLVLSIPTSHAELIHPEKQDFSASNPTVLERSNSGPIWKGCPGNVDKISVFLCSHHQIILHPALAPCNSPLRSPAGISRHHRGLTQMIWVHQYASGPSVKPTRLPLPEDPLRVGSQCQAASTISFSPLLLTGILVPIPIELECHFRSHMRFQVSE